MLSPGELLQYLKCKSCRKLITELSYPNICENYCCAQSPNWSFKKFNNNSVNWSFNNFIRPVNGDHWFKWVSVESKVLSPSLSLSLSLCLCWRSVSTAVVAFRQWRFSELDERKTHSLVYSIWNRIENSVKGTVGVEANAGVKQSLEPRYMGSTPWKLVFRHREANQISEAFSRFRAAFRQWLWSPSGGELWVGDISVRTREQQKAKAANAEPEVRNPKFWPQI